MEMTASTKPNQFAMRAQMSKNTKNKLAERSYEFAVVHKLLTLDKVEDIMPPRFPTSRRESHVGYDVTMDFKGVPVSLQFKIPRRLRAANAREHENHLGPYCRIDIREKQKTRMTNRAADKCRLGFFVAPKFDSHETFERVFCAGEILEQSVWIPLKCLASQNPGKIRCVTFTEDRALIHHDGYRNPQCLSEYPSWQAAEAKIREWGSE